MDPVSQFKFACPNCSQHLQARPGEAGRTTECPSCFKKLIVPQAPTSGGGNLIITASLAESRRNPLPSVSQPSAGASKPVAKGLRIYLVVALVALLAATAGVVFLKKSPQEASPIQLWTDNSDELQLTEGPVAGELNGWSFEAPREIWRDTRLILRQEKGSPVGLRLEITFPLTGGELVAGKSYKLSNDDPPFASPIRILWKDEQGANQSRSYPSGYLLWVLFDDVTKERVSGRIHLCLADPTQSWVAGSFQAQVKTVVK